MQLNVCPKEPSTLSSSSSSCCRHSLETQVLANGRSIHYVRDPESAGYLARFFCCPLANLDSLHGIPTKFHANTLFSRKLEMREQISEQIADYLEDLSSQEKPFLTSALEESESLVKGWSTVADEPINYSLIPLESLQKYFCRWSLRAVFGFFKDLDAIAAHMHKLTTTPLPNEPILAEVQRMQQIMDIKSLLRGNLGQQEQFEGSLITLLKNRGLQDDLIINHCFDTLLIMQESGARCMDYMLRVLANNQDVQDSLRETAKEAEKIYVADTWKAYLDALAPLGDFLNGWKGQYFPEKWEGTVQFPARFEKEGQVYEFKVGDTVSYQPLSTSERGEIPPFHCLIGDKEHLCEDEVIFNQILQVLLAKILINLKLMTKQSEMAFTIKVFPIPAEPIRLDLSIMSFANDSDDD